jgi:signal transduction histidine kinase
MEPTFLRERLFRPFDSTKGSKGMGIGAYQAREFIRNAGGEITVESRAGQGTTFRISLPVVQRRSSEQRLQQAGSRE